MMWTGNCGAQPVVKDGNVVGMVTDRDLFIALGTGNKKAADLQISEIMNRDLSLCSPGDDLRSAMKTMGQRKLYRLLAVDQHGQFKGILSVDDIVLYAGAGGPSNEEVVKMMKAICERQIHRVAA